MLERKLYSLPAELLLLRGQQEKFKIKAKLSPAEANDELGNTEKYKGKTFICVFSIFPPNIIFKNKIGFNGYIPEVEMLHQKPMV